MLIEICTLLSIYRSQGGSVIWCWEQLLEKKLACMSCIGSFQHLVDFICKVLSTGCHKHALLQASEQACEEAVIETSK